ncbi:MAG TPA: xanthine dehydrogenase family protein subunit M [Casimicrobiaceae bacterium]|nr:xanthine dehydrogenase family protein subunit M [Casimicrobiaceae bacterium]
MKPPPFEHHLPHSLGEAVATLRSLENARVIAGGQSLMPMLNLRVAYPDHLVDLGGIADLAYIRESADVVRIGAMTTQRDIEFSEIVRRRLPLMSEAVLSVGHRQTRNRGTIGGSLCNLDPAAELPLVALAFDATIGIANADGTRELPMVEFAAGYMTPAIEADDIVSEVDFRPWPAGHGYAFDEYARRKGDFAIVSVAAMIALGSDGRVARASLALGGVGPVPMRVPEAEAVLTGAFPEASLFTRAAEPCNAIEPLEDAFVPPWYRRKLAPVLAERVLATAAKRATFAHG